MNITKIAIEKNRVTATILFIILVGGIIAYFNLPRDYDPGFVLRIARVITYFPGAGPDRVEQLVTDKIEKVVQEIPELEYVRSQSKTGVSIIDVWIQDRYKNMRPIWDNLRRKVDRVSSNLPGNVIGPFVNDEFSDVFGIVLGVTGEGFSYAELKDIADEVRDELLRIGDVAKVDIYGAQDERVFVEYSNARLSEIGISPYQLMKILMGRNIIIPGGNIKVGTERIELEPSGNFESVDAMKRTVINVPGKSEMIYLGDIVDIHRGYVDPPATTMRSSGRPSIGLAVSMRTGGNLIRLGNDITGLLKRLESYYPYGIEFEMGNFAPGEVETKVNTFRNNLLQAIAVVMGVMLITLGLRTGFIVASLIPMAMLMSLLVMFLLGIGIDQMSLASLIIALGMLVDNAIVMSESILVQMKSGKKPLEAAVDSSRELVVPLLTSSLTTAASFLPIFLAKSRTGEYTAPLFKVVTITLLCSWFLSLIMIPMLCARFIKVKNASASSGDGMYESWFYRNYRRTLIFSLRHRVAAVISVVIVFLGVMSTFKYLPVIFFPPSDRLFFKAEFELKPGTAIEETELMVKDIEGFVQRELVVSGGRSEGVSSWITHIGNGGPRFLINHQPEQGMPEYVLMVLNVTTLDVLPEIMPKLENYAIQNYPEVKAKLTRIQNGPPVRDPIQIRISGKDEDVLFDIVDDVKAKLHSLDGPRNITDDWGLRSKKIVVKVNQPRARRAGVTSQDIAISLRAGLSGFELTEYREDDKIIPVVLRSVAADRKDIGKLETMNVYVQATGHSVPLKQVADIEVKWQSPEIIRRNRLKTVTVSAALFPGYTADGINRQMIPWLDSESIHWGIGYRYEIGGETEESGKANSAIKDQLPVAALIILLLLIVQFNSFRQVMIIMVTIPLGLIGVVLGLHATRLYFGFMTLLGIVSLAGIVVNNAIVLIERIKLEIEENGLPPQRAVVEASQRRMRPILLTTATTAFGMVPLLYGGGPIWAPMAVSIIAGLLFSTVLTLGVVPILYSLLFGVSFDDFRY